MKECGHYCKEIDIDLFKMNEKTATRNSLYDLRRFTGVTVKIKNIINRPLFRAGLALFAMVLILAAFNGCASSQSKKNSRGAKSDVEPLISRMALAEQQQRYGLYELIYSNAGSKEITDVRIAQGQLLMNDQGVFRFEQRKKDPNKSVWVYFNPNEIILVVFPKLKMAYRGSPAILSGPEGDKLVAAYDGLRMVLGQSEVWNHPERHKVEPASGMGVSVQQEGRPYRWSIRMEGASSGNPIESMSARKGFRELCTIERKVNSIEHFSRENKNAFSAGTAGQLQNALRWSVALSGDSRITDLVFTPYPINKSDAEKTQSLFKTPDLESDLQVQELSLDIIRDWLNMG